MESPDAKSQHSKTQSHWGNRTAGPNMYASVNNDNINNELANVYNKIDKGM